MSYTIIIPARYASTRLPGKPLLDINGRCLLQHVYESARRSSAENIIVATDDPRIGTAATGFGARVCLTAVYHASGTERLAEVAERFRMPDDRIIVNLQGDEFGMPAALLDQVAGQIESSESVVMATLCEPLDSLVEYNNPNVVKVIVDRDGRALYFSRSPIPWHDPAQLQSEENIGHRHIGLYAYRVGFLRRYVRMPASPLEQCERLEQLRALDQGVDVRVAVAVEKPGIGIDTPEDLERARKMVNGER